MVPCTSSSDRPGKKEFPELQDRTKTEENLLYSHNNALRGWSPFGLTFTIFTNFKIPTTGDLASKMEQLDTGRTSENEKHKVYKLIQEFSHGSDPTNTIEHKDKTESREAIRVLLNIVEESDPKHFELLKKILPS